MTTTEMPVMELDVATVTKTIRHYREEMGRALYERTADQQPRARAVPGVGSVFNTHIFRILLLSNHNDKRSKCMVNIFCFSSKILY